MTDWAKTVRTLRARLRLKQGGLANLLDVSQTYISRLEAGLTQPAPRVAAALQRLGENPRTRSVFDDFLSAIRHSPYRCALLGPNVEGGLVIMAASRDLTHLAVPTETLEAHPKTGLLCEQAHLLIAHGLEHFATAHCFWLDRASSETCWRTQFTPVCDGAGAWFLHMTLLPASREAYDAHIRVHGNQPLLVEHEARRQKAG
jgi:transcriptional regulator with XRE-family HTH domain